MLSVAVCLITCTKEVRLKAMIALESRLSFRKRRITWSQASVNSAGQSTEISYTNVNNRLAIDLCEDISYEDKQSAYIILDFRLGISQEDRQSFTSWFSSITIVASVLRPRSLWKPLPISGDVFLSVKSTDADLNRICLTYHRFANLFTLLFDEL